MSEVDIMQVVIVVGVLFLIVRNLVKDKSDGRNPIGGGGKRGNDPKMPRK
jgi:hypothetical protein